MSDSRNPKDAIARAKVPLHLWPIAATMYGCWALFCGKTKYGSLNWRATPVLASVYYGALLRHAGRWWEGEDLDPDDGTPHLGNALACLAILIDAHVSGTLIDDRQFNGAGVIASLSSFNHLAPTLEAKYAEKNPKHYTIQDNAGS
jgi:hypothetical protein